MQILLSTLITVSRRIRPLVYFSDFLVSKGFNILHTKGSATHTLRSPILFSRLRRSLRRVKPALSERVYIFTKPEKPNKLYVDNNKGLFLSSGIILRFMHQDAQRFLKKRLKTWHNYIKAIRFLQKRRFVAVFNDMFGKKSVIFSKLPRSGIKLFWVFIRIMRLDPYGSSKRTRRIKRWIKKKYYQLGVGERR